MVPTPASETYRSGFDPDIRALFDQSFKRAEETGLISVFDPSRLESVEPLLLPKRPRRETIEELLKRYEA